MSQQVIKILTFLMTKEEILFSIFIQRMTPLDALLRAMTLRDSMINVASEDPGGAVNHPNVVNAIRDVEGKLGGVGRVLVRPSGTEPLLRVMVEGRNSVDVRGYAETIADVALNSLDTRTGTLRSQ